MSDNSETRMNRLRPTWFTKNDDHILELLGTTGAALNKRGLDVNLELRDTPMAYSTIKRRIDKLEKSGFVEDIGEDGSYYRLSERGSSYLTGNSYGTTELTGTSQNHPNDTDNPYGTDTTEGVNPLTVEPTDYDILTEIVDSEPGLTDQDLLNRIRLDPNRAKKRLTELKQQGAIQQKETGLEAAMAGQLILMAFEEGKEVMNEVKITPDTTTTVTSPVAIKE